MSCTIGVLSDGIPNSAQHSQLFYLGHGCGKSELEILYYMYLLQTCNMRKAEHGCSGTVLHRSVHRAFLDMVLGLERKLSGVAQASQGLGTEHSHQIMRMSSPTI